MQIEKMIQGFVFMVSGCVCAPAVLFKVGVKESNILRQPLKLPSYSSVGEMCYSGCNLSESITELPVYPLVSGIKYLSVINTEMLLPSTYNQSHPTSLWRDCSVYHYLFFLISLVN